MDIINSHIEELDIEKQGWKGCVFIDISKIQYKKCQKSPS